MALCSQKNRELGIQASTANPSEYENRRAEFKDIAWVFERGITMPGFTIYFQMGIGFHKAIHIFQTIDAADAWTDYDKLRGMLSDTCTLVHSRPGIRISMQGAVPEVSACWDEGVIYICNVSDQWFRSE